MILCYSPTQSETRGRPFVAPRAAVSRQVCTLPANFGDLVQLVTEPQRSLFVARMTPTTSQRGWLTLCDGPTLSETQGRPFVAPRAAVSRQVCTQPANFGDLVQLVTEPQRSLFVASSDASRHPVCVCHCAMARHCRRLEGCRQFLISRCDFFFGSRYNCF